MNTKKKVINTPVDLEVFEKFKGYCQERNLTMSFVIETFMKALIDGDYELNVKLQKKEQE